MRLPILVAAVIPLAGCSQTLATFFGTSDPCAQAVAFHVGFQSVAAIEPKVDKYSKAERTLYAAVRSQCSDGNITKFTLTKTLEAYAEAIAEWKQGNPADAETVKAVIKDAG